jgi:transglutaminase-like putative cysteine protease
MLRWIPWLCAPLALVLAAPALANGASRTFTFHYAVEVPVAAGAGPVHVWVPLAAKNGVQQVVEERVAASIPGAVESEDAHGNRFWHGHVARADGRPVTVAVETTVTRRAQPDHAPAASTALAPAASTALAPGASPALGPGEREALARYLAPNRRVPVNHPILAPIQSEVRARAASGDPAALARAIYDWVVDNVEYKKVGTGWGNGDTFWACSERYGNCTDFHALLISLARSEGIPARFEIGFPVPEDAASGEIGGYHCWVEMYLPAVGWFPVDASEASKRPAERERFYGAQPADRIHFSTGRDLVLGPAQQAGPLNYFVYPHVEVDGSAYTGAIEKQFSYRAH